MHSMQHSKKQTKLIYHCKTNTIIMGQTATQKPCACMDSETQKSGDKTHEEKNSHGSCWSQWDVHTLPRCEGTNCAGFISDSCSALLSLSAEQAATLGQQHISWVLLCGPALQIHAATAGKSTVQAELVGVRSLTVFCFLLSVKQVFILALIEKAQVSK